MEATRQKIPQTAEVLLLAAALLLVISIGILGYSAGAAFRSSEEQARTTRQVLDNTNALLSSLKDAETGQRGFLLTAENRYLEPYRQALTEIPTVLDTLARVENESKRPDQAQRVERLRPLVKDKLGELEQIIELRRTHGVDAALASHRPRQSGNGPDSGDLLRDPGDHI